MKVEQINGEGGGQFTLWSLRAHKRSLTCERQKQKENVIKRWGKKPDKSRRSSPMLHSWQWCVGLIKFQSVHWWLVYPKMIAVSSQKCSSCMDQHKKTKNSFRPTHNIFKGKRVLPFSSVYIYVSHTRYHTPASVCVLRLWLWLWTS